MTARTLTSNFSVTLASARMRFITITRYPGQLFTDMIIPIVFAAMPILLGEGEQPAMHRLHTRSAPENGDTSEEN